MPVLGSLQVRLGLDAAAFQTHFNSFAKATERKVKAFQRSMSGIGNLGTLIGGAGLTAGLSDVVTTAGDFQQSLSQVAAASGATGGEMASLSELALEMGRTTVFGANQAAAAMLDLSKAGITPAQISGGTLAATMQLAATEGMELSRAAEVMAEQMGAFGLTAADAAGIADTLAGASIASTASVEGLAQALSQSAAVANLSGATINETAGALALLAQNGIKGSDAGTSLKTMFLRLVPPTKEAAVAMKKYGLSFKDSNGKLDSLTTVAGKLQDRLGKLTQVERQSALQTIFGTDAYRAAAIMMKGGSAELEKYISATRDKNAAEKLSEARTSGFNGAIARLRNSFESLKIEIARGGLLDFFAGLADKLASAAAWFAKSPPWIKNTAITLALVGAALPPIAFGLSTVAGLIPPLLTGFSGLAAFMLGPVGIIAAITGIAVAAAGLEGSFTDSIRNISTNNKPLVEDLKSSWESLAEKSRTIWQDITSTWTTSSAELAVSQQTATSENKIFATSWDEFMGGILAAAAYATEAVEAFITAMEKLGQWFATKWATDVQPYLDKISNGFTKGVDSDPFLRKVRDSMFGSNVGTEYLNNFSDAATRSAAALEAFGETGKKVSDEAVGHSWLTDLCEKGIANFRSLITSGVTPAADSLSSFGDIGDGLQIDLPGYAPRAIPVNDRTLRPLADSANGTARDFQSAWAIALNDTNQAIDDFVRTGSLSFKDLMRSIVADFASAQLKKAASGLFSGVSSAISGMFAGSSGGFMSSIGSIGSSVLKGLASFDGGGYTGDSSRTGGIDGKGGSLAIMHPRETVIDHAAVGKSVRRHSRPSVNVSTPITLMPGVSREELARILPQVQRNIIDIIPALVQRGGRYAAAFGQ